MWRKENRVFGWCHADSIDSSDIVVSSQLVKSRCFSIYLPDFSHVYTSLFHHTEEHVRLRYGDHSYTTLQYDITITSVNVAGVGSDPERHPVRSKAVVNKDKAGSMLWYFCFSVIGQCAFKLKFNF